MACLGSKPLTCLGSVSNSHGVKGLEHCHFLKSIDDAGEIRNQISLNLERACLPTTSDEERRRLLSFVVCGGGPTGVEFAAEMVDLLNEDLPRYFPKVLRNEASVHLLQSRGHILNTYDEALSEYAEVGSLPGSSYQFHPVALTLLLAGTFRSRAGGSSDPRKSQGGTGG